MPLPLPDKKKIASRIFARFQASVAFRRVSHLLLAVSESYKVSELKSRRPLKIRETLPAPGQFIDHGERTIARSRPRVTYAQAASVGVYITGKCLAISTSQLAGKTMSEKSFIYYCCYYCHYCHYQADDPLLVSSSSIGHTHDLCLKGWDCITTNNNDCNYNYYYLCLTSIH